MLKPRSPLPVLTAHFFRRFFDNDTVHVDGDTVTTVARAVAAAAVPGLMFTFFLQTHYPYRAVWGALEDRYFFVLFSFVTLGAVTTFAGEMLFPDRIDFLVLTPLPIRPGQMLFAKACALGGFLLLFLFAANVFGWFMYSAICHFAFLHQLYAHGAAVTLAGCCAALFVLSWNGLLLCTLPARRLRIATPLLQMLSITAFVLLLLEYGFYGDGIHALLTPPLHTARWLAPTWFLAVYDRLLLGAAAQPYANGLSRYAWRATCAVMLLVFATYPIAWRRTRRRVLEGGSEKRLQAHRWLTSASHALVRPPAGRAIFHFVGQTIGRNVRYQTYLALYAGVGLALAVACVVDLQVQGSTWMAGVSNKGLRMALPLLLFWLVAGLRTAFAFPLTLKAAWIFRVTGTDQAACAAAARSWVMLAGTVLMAGILLVDRFAGFSFRQMLVQGVTGGCLVVLLTDGFLLERSIPFTRPRLPGRANFPLMLTLYVGALAPFLYGVVALETWMEQNLSRVAILLLLIFAAHRLVGRLHQKPMEIEEQMEGYDDAFQLLGLR